jgi:peptide deformylase
MDTVVRGAAMILPIIIHPDSLLREIAKPVLDFDDEVKKLITDMFETMYAAPGVGLAAPQVGVSKRVIVIDLMPDGIRDEDDKKHFEELKECGYTGPFTLVNPELIEKSGIITWEEGCLSLPGITAEIDRADHVRVKGLDRQGRPFEVEASEFFAVAIQHEIDHLDGKLLIDYLSKLKQVSITRKLRREKEKSQKESKEASA